MCRRRKPQNPQFRSGNRDAWAPPRRLRWKLVLKEADTPLHCVRFFPGRGCLGSHLRPHQSGVRGGGAARGPLQCRARRLGQGRSAVVERGMSTDVPRRQCEGDPEPRSQGA